MPPFLSGPLFFPPWPLAGPTSKKFQNYFFKILSKVPRVVFCLVFITGLGMEIGHRQPKPQRKPRLQFSANPAVHDMYRRFSRVVRANSNLLFSFLGETVFLFFSFLPFSRASLDATPQAGLVIADFCL